MSNRKAKFRRIATDPDQVHGMGFHAKAKAAEKRFFERNGRVRPVTEANHKWARKAEIEARNL